MLGNTALVIGEVTENELTMQDDNMKASLW